MLQYMRPLHDGVLNMTSTAEIIKDHTPPVAAISRASNRSEPPPDFAAALGSAARATAIAAATAGSPIAGRAPLAEAAAAATAAAALGPRAPCCSLDASAVGQGTTDTLWIALAWLPSSACVSRRLLMPFTCC